MAENKYSYSYDWQYSHMQEVEIKKIDGIYCLKVNLVDKKAIKILFHKNLIWQVNGEIEGSYTPIYPIEKAKECFSEGVYELEVQKLSLNYTPSIDDYFEENGMLTPKKAGRIEYKWKIVLSDIGGYRVDIVPSPVLDIKILETENTELSKKLGDDVNFGWVFVNGIYVGKTVHYQYSHHYNSYNVEHFMRIKNWADPPLLEFFQCYERWLSELLYRELVALSCMGCI